MFDQFQKSWGRLPYLTRRRWVSASVIGNFLFAFVVAFMFGSGQSASIVKGCGGFKDIEIQPRDGGGIIFDASHQAPSHPVGPVPSPLSALSNNCELPSGKCQASTFQGQNLVVTDAGIFYGQVSVLNWTKVADAGSYGASFFFDDIGFLGLGKNLDTNDGDALLFFEPSTGSIYSNGNATFSGYIAGVGGFFGNSRIQQVAPGTAPTDAVNLSQLGSTSSAPACPFTVLLPDAGILYDVACDGSGYYRSASGVALWAITSTGYMDNAKGVGRLATSGGAGTPVSVSAASPPSTGQVLTATTASTATWQTPSTSVGLCPFRVLNADAGVLTTIGCNGELSVSSTLPSVLLDVDPNTNNATFLGEVIAAGANVQGNKVINVGAGTTSTDAVNLGQLDAGVQRALASTYETIGSSVTSNLEANVAAQFVPPAGVTTTAKTFTYFINHAGNGGGSFTVGLYDVTNSAFVCSANVSPCTATGGMTFACTTTDGGSLDPGHTYQVGYSDSCSTKPGIYLATQVVHQ